MTILVLLACCGGAIGISTHRAGAALKPVCDLAVVGKAFDRGRFEAMARKQDVMFTPRPAVAQAGARR